MEGRGATTFKNLTDLIENLKSTELIDKVCEGHPFSSFFSVQGKDAGDEGLIFLLLIFSQILKKIQKVMLNWISINYDS